MAVTALLDLKRPDAITEGASYSQLKGIRVTLAKRIRGKDRPKTKAAVPPPHTCHAEKDTKESRRSATIEPVAPQRGL